MSGLMIYRDIMEIKELHYLCIAVQSQLVLLLQYSIVSKMQYSYFQRVGRIADKFGKCNAILRKFGQSFWGLNFPKPKRGQDRVPQNSDGSHRVDVPVLKKHFSKEVSLINVINLKIMFTYLVSQLSQIAGHANVCCVTFAKIRQFLFIGMGLANSQLNVGLSSCDNFPNCLYSLLQIQQSRILSGDSE